MGDPEPGLSYKFQADFAKSPYIIDAMVAFRFSPAITVTAGQMKIPFSAESLLNDLLNPPVSRSRAVLGLAPGRDTGVQARDTGVNTFRAGSRFAPNRSGRATDRSIRAVATHWAPGNSRAIWTCSRELTG